MGKVNIKVVLEISVTLKTSGKNINEYKQGKLTVGEKVSKSKVLIKKK